MKKSVLFLSILIILGLSTSCNLDKNDSLYKTGSTISATRRAILNNIAAYPFR